MPEPSGQNSAKCKGFIVMENLDEIQLPAHLENGDGFDQSDDRGRVIIGQIEKFLDGDWTTGGLPIDPKRRIVAVATDVIIQRWKDQRVVELITAKPLPDLDILNDAVPRKEWEVDLNGNPRPPYQRTFLTYFLDLDTADRTTFVSSTAGGGIAVRGLKDKVIWMRRLRGANVVPQVELTFAPMPTRFGMKKRPDFKVVGWADLSSGLSAAPAQLPPVGLKQIADPQSARRA
jgi:hypothetical protein